MARRTREDAHATRERILDAALVCLLRHGPAGATLELIATECGYSRGAIYWHFGSRQNLLGELPREGGQMHPKDCGKPPSGSAVTRSSFCLRTWSGYLITRAAPHAFAERLSFCCALVHHMSWAA